MNRLLLFTVVVGAVVAMSVLPGSDVNHVQYLRNFGYISKDSSLVQSDTDMSKAISEFQSMAGIEQTGSMNSETRAMMRMPRCGVHDQTVHMTTLQRRVKRHARLGTLLWASNSITYKISNYTHRISHSDVDKLAREAFAYWSWVTPLTFRQVWGNEWADIHIKFATGDHGDGAPFDGRHGVLAHAEAPRSGTVHFDDAEHWVVGEAYGGITLKQVMTHEFGHLLGMAHSQTKAAVMWAYYKGYEPKFNLDIDDIEGIQSMYGSGDGKVTPIHTTNIYDTTTTVIHKGDNICADPIFDAVTIDKNQVYAFKGANYYQLGGMNTQKAHLIESKFIGVPNDINAALAISDTMYFFKGNQVYKYHGGRVQEGFPKFTKTVFRGLPSRIDSAFSFGSYAYFIVDGTYYRSTIGRGGVASRAVIVDAFRNSPKKIEAIFHWEKFGVIAFSGGKFYTSPMDTKNFGNPFFTLQWLQC